MLNIRTLLSRNYTRSKLKNTPYMCSNKLNLRLVTSNPSRMARNFATFNFSKKTNFYEMLEIEKTAEKKDIKKAFRVMSKCLYNTFCNFLQITRGFLAQILEISILT